MRWILMLNNFAKINVFVTSAFIFKLTHHWSPHFLSFSRERDTNSTRKKKNFTSMSSLLENTVQIQTQAFVKIQICMKLSLHREDTELLDGCCFGKNILSGVFCPGQFFEAFSALLIFPFISLIVPGFSLLSWRGCTSASLLYVSTWNTTVLFC